MQQSIELCWCHICKKQFESSVSTDLMKCTICKQEFCEIIDPINDPRGFIPYGENQLQNQSSTQSQTQQRQQPQTIIHNTRNQIPTRFQQQTTNLFDNLLQQMYPNTQIQPTQSLEQLINFISRNDPNKQKSPPASQYAINALLKLNLQSECCNICKGKYQLKQALQMPCQHHFHPDCLIPWLKQHNSCPVCSFELVTDDDDYNERKNLK